MNIQDTKDRLIGRNVSSVQAGNFYLVDKANNESLYNDLINDELLMPPGFFVALKDGETIDVRVGFGQAWSQSIPFGGGGGEVEVTSDNITDASDVGKAVLTAADAAAARDAIGAGTSDLEIGTTATTALAGNTTIPAAATWEDISGKPAFVAEGADAAAARTALGLGTAATTASTAYATAAQGTLAGTAVQPDDLPAFGTAASADVGDFPSIADFDSLVTRVEALETPEA